MRVLALHTWEVTIEWLSWGLHSGKRKTFVCRLLDLRSSFPTFQLSLALGVIYFFLFVCLFWKHKHCHIALTWHNFIWVIFCEIIQVEKQLQSFQISTKTEEMSRDYLIHRNTETGSKHSSMKQMPDHPNPENNQESRFQNTCMQLL